MAPHDVALAWSPIFAWLQQHRPDLSAGLRPGASSEGLGVLTKLGVPESWRVWWAIHDGEGPVLFDGWSWLPIDHGPESVVSEHAAMLEVSRELSGHPPPLTVGPVRARWGHPRWVPFATDYAGGFLCIDLAPAAGGTLGQVILVDDEDREVLFDGVLELLEEVRRRMDSGEEPDALDLAADPWTEDSSEPVATAPAPTESPGPMAPPPPPSPPAEVHAEPVLRSGRVEPTTDGIRVTLDLSRDEQQRGTTLFVDIPELGAVGVRIPSGAFAGARLRMPEAAGPGRVLELLVARITDA